MTKHNAPYQIIKRKIPDITQACGYRVELVQQWRYPRVPTGSESGLNWTDWQDVPIVDDIPPAISTD